MNVLDVKIILIIVLDANLIITTEYQKLVNALNVNQIVLHVIKINLIVLNVMD